MTSEWFEMVCRSSLGHRTSQEQTYDLARLMLERGIPGDFVECGVYAGAQAALMARSIIDQPLKERDGRKVHLFDTFAGIPQPGPHDTELASNIGGESRCSIEAVKGIMEVWGISEDLLVYHQGLFADSMTDHGIERISLLRLDADLYESTKTCMERLYPLVVKGGYVIVDDFDLTGCRKAVLEAVNPAPIAWRKPE